jgi:hypothetical protein
MNANWFWELEFANDISGDPEIGVLVNALGNAAEELVVGFVDVRKTCADSRGSLHCRVSDFSTVVRICHSETTLHLVESQVFLESTHVRVHVSYKKNTISFIKKRVYLINYQCIMNPGI